MRDHVGGFGHVDLFHKRSQVIGSNIEQKGFAYNHLRVYMEEGLDRWGRVHNSQIPLESVQDYTGSKFRGQGARVPGVGLESLVMALDPFELL